MSKTPEAPLESLRTAPRAHGLRPTRAIVDLDALARNFHALRRRLPPGTEVMPVVKADAYGHGAAVISGRLQDEGARAFAVAVVEEGAELRREGITGEILVMGSLTHEQLPELLRHGLVANAHSLELLADLAAYSRAHRKAIPVHLKVDTGMTRLGLLPEELPQAIELLKIGGRWLRLEGLFQNFASADDAESSQTASQVRVLSDIYATLAQAGLRPPCLHVANSAGTWRPPAWPDSLPPPARVRPGLVLYAPFPEVGAFEPSDVMSFVSIVDQVKLVPEGTRVGYGGAFTARRPTALAIVPAGYADGVPRSLFGRGQVVVRGRRCPIVGRVSMDLTAVDVTELTPPPSPGEDVLFFGSLGPVRLGVEEMAAAAGTTSWEILCGVGPRVPRIVVQGGASVRVISRFLETGETPTYEAT